MIFHVLKHELRLIFREPRFWIPFLVPPVILAASQWIAVSRYGVEMMENMEGYMMLLLGCLMAPMGAPLAADIFAGERERNSMELLQLSPVKPYEIFWGKFLAVLPFPLCFCLLVQLGYGFAHGAFSDQGMAGVTCFAAICGGVSACLVVNVFALWLSLRAKTVRSATQGSLFLILPMLILVQVGYEGFLASWTAPLAVLVGAILVCGLVSVLGMRRFASQV